MFVQISIFVITAEEMRPKQRFVHSLNIIVIFYIFLHTVRILCFMASLNFPEMFKSIEIL